MTYNFLTDADIHTILKEEFKIGMTDAFYAAEGPGVFILRAEKTALQQMINKLSGRFDTTGMFTIPGEWDPEKAYKMSERCRCEDLFYISLGDNTGSKPAKGSSNWKEDDPRDSLLVMYCADITVYHLHARHNPRAITELRVKRYEDAIKWLDRVMTNQENPPFPPIVEPSEGPLEYGFDMAERKHYF